MTTSTYTVTGMTCGHCVASVTEEVQEIQGVADVKVTLETGELVVSGDFTHEAVKQAVEEAGYQLA